MAKNLVIVESPAKAKTIQKILGKGFEVLSSMGHVKDLPKSRLGVDVENGFTPSYIVIKDRRKMLGDILNSARSAATVFLAQLGPAGAQQSAPGFASRAPFNATVSNTTPLAFGMDVADASRALGEPLSHVSGRPGDEIYLAIRNIGGSGLLNHRDRLFLQFRKGRLTGWKGDWGHNWMWQ